MPRRDNDPYKAATTAPNPNTNPAPIQLPVAAAAAFALCVAAVVLAVVAEAAPVAIVGPLWLVPEAAPEDADEPAPEATEVIVVLSVESPLADAPPAVTSVVLTADPVAVVAPTAEAEAVALLQAEAAEADAEE